NTFPSQRSAEGARTEAPEAFLSASIHVIPGEDPAEFDALVRGYREQLSPDGPVEDFFFTTLLLCDWRKRRLLRIESQFLRILSKGKDPISVLIEGYSAEGG